LKTTAERQQKLFEKRTSAGMRPVKVWLTGGDYEALRGAFPGSRGGVDWQRVVDVALRKPQRVVCIDPSQPLRDYWRPNGKADPRCQCATVTGARCKARGTVVVKALDSNDKLLGEFISCSRHAADFRPHGSILE